MTGLLAVMALVGVLGACGDSDGETVTEGATSEDDATTTPTPPSTAAPDAGDPADSEETEEPDEVDPPGAQPSGSLEGAWQLDGIVDGDDVSPVPEGGAAMLTFESDAVGMSVKECNQGGSEIEVSGQEIEVDGLISTLMACAEPAATVEAAIVRTFDGATITYEIEDDTLTLTHPDGHGLVLRPAE